MRMRTIATTGQTISSARIYCDGFVDHYGQWHNSFVCPLENLVQYFCCGTEQHRYCCPSSRYSSNETSRPLDLPSMVDHSSTSGYQRPPSFIQNQVMITKQFEQFQRYFLPIFLLTTTILFLVSIAIWFWLYKHKAFYSFGQDEPMESRISSSSSSALRRQPPSSTAV